MKLSDTEIPNQMPANITNEKRLQELISFIDADKLSLFVLRQAKENTAFREALEKEFAPKPNVNPSQDYSAEVENCFLTENKYNRYSYKGGYNLVKEVTSNLSNLLHKADFLYQQKTYGDVADIAIQVLRSVGDNYEDYFYDECDFAYCCQTAADLIMLLADNPEVPPSLKSRLQTEIAEMMNNNTLDNYCLLDTSELLIHITLSTSQPEDGIKLLDNLLKENPESYQCPQWIKHRIQLCRKSGKEEEAEKTIQHYLYLPEIRKVKTSQLIEKQLYDEALTIIGEGIDIAEKQGHYGTVNEWKSCKLEVHILQKDKSKIQETAEELFSNGRDTEKYYLLLKELIPTIQWNSYLDNLLRINKKKLQQENLANILVNEQRWEQLLELIKDAPLTPYGSLLLNFESFLRAEYPKELLAIFSENLRSYAQMNTGRSHYIFIATVMKRMQAYPDGTETVKALAAYFREKYKNRPAMKDELSIF